MSRNAQLLYAFIGISIFGMIAYAAVRNPSDRAGAGMPAEIIDPLTLQRTRTTWDQVFKHGLPDMAGAGGYLAPIPNKNYWGHVVKTGERHPCEVVAVSERRELHPRGEPDTAASAK